MILVDTSAWSRAVRWQQGPERQKVRELLARLMGEDLIYIPAIALQELLSGVRRPTQRAQIEADMKPFPVLLATVEDHLLAAGLVNQCAAAGFNAGSIDALIAAQAIQHGAALLTYDDGFGHMSAQRPELTLIERG